MFFRETPKQQARRDARAPKTQKFLPREKCFAFIASSPAEQPQQKSNPNVMNLGDPFPWEVMKREHLRLLLLNYTLEEVAKILIKDMATLYRWRRNLGLEHVVKRPKKKSPPVEPQPPTAPPPDA